MSHIATYGTQLKGVNLDLLKSAFEAVAAKHEVKLSKSITDYYGNQVTTWDGSKIVAAIKTDQIPQGVAVVLDAKNNPSFVALTDQGRKAVTDLQKEVENAYKALATVIALQQLGYRVNSKRVDGGIVSEGERE